MARRIGDIMHLEDGTVLVVKPEKHKCDGCFFYQRDGRNQPWCVSGIDERFQDCKEDAIIFRKV